MDELDKLRERIVGAELTIAVLGERFEEMERMLEDHNRRIESTFFEMKDKVDTISDTLTKYKYIGIGIIAAVMLSGGDYKIINSLVTLMAGG